MSINVNVTGNPISIKRGKMVALDPDYARKEFEKRRRIRLEQVRQQSKNIAEEVRNKVRKEKSKQLSDIERKGENELKKWQARKLLALQKQYEECLNDIGLGHTQAAVEEESECAAEVQKEAYNYAAKERGKHAAQKLKDDHQKEQRNKMAQEQKKKFNQAVENTRSTMVANLNKYKKAQSPFKKKKRKKVFTDINISSRISNESESENEVPALLNLASSDSDSEADVTTNPTRGGKSVPLPTADDTGAYTSTSLPSSIPQKSHTLNNDDEKLKSIHDFSPTKLKSFDVHNSDSGGNYPMDTRISDRIKNRTLINSGYNHYDSICDNHVPKIRESRRTIRSNPSEGLSKKLTQELTSKVNIMPIVEEDNQSKSDTKRKLEEEEIPSKPTVTLRTTQNSSQKLVKPTQSESNTSNLNKVQYYDHKNRYNREYVPDNLNVQKIPEDSVEVLPSPGSEAEFMERMYKRDHEAEVRGQKALEKEKIHRDYNEMMKHLPLLQKQERIASIPASKSTFHMSDERLKEYEKKKQNRMENAYEKLFPSSRIITIPPKSSKATAEQDSGGTLPYRTISLEDNPPILNVASWDIDDNSKPGLVVAPKDVESELLREATKNVLGESSDPVKTSERRKESLQKMLKSLTYHRDKLARELAVLPEDSNLHSILGDLEDVDKIIQTGKSVEKSEKGSVTSLKAQKQSRSKLRKPEIIKEDSSSSLSPPYTTSSKVEVSKHRGNYISESSSSASPPSKLTSSTKMKTEQHKLRRPSPLVLQNMSTQTTPTVELTKSKDPEAIQPSVPTSTLPSSSKNLDKKPKPCECPQQLGNESSDVCEIVIKISEDGKPKICVSPTKLRDKKVVVQSETKDIFATPSVLSKTDAESSIFEKSEKPPQKSLRTEKHKNVEGQKITKQTRESEKVRQKEKIGSSWREFLNQNSTNSSTSYYSPPETIRKQQTKRVDPQLNQACPCGSQAHSQFHHRHPHVQPAAKHHLSNILKNKPQQSNILSENSTVSSISQNTNQVKSFLFPYIKRLLMMSRQNVDDLAASSVSEVSTPGSSVINSSSNNPTDQLQNIMKHFNLNQSDVEQIISSSDGSNIRYNTVGSVTMSSSGSSRIVNSTPINHADVRQMTLDEYSTENYPNVLAVYNKLAESCAKKIENLAAMIEKVRLDKLNMLHSPGSGSDKENSTKYMDLPLEFKKQNRPEEFNIQSPDSTSEQEKLNRQLLEIDYDFAERLKKMTSAEIKEMFPMSSSSSSSSSNSDSSRGSLKSDNQGNDSADKGLMKRFRELRESGKKIDAPDTNGKERENKSDVQDLDVPFVPLLIDIPRLPKLESTKVSSNGGLYKNNEKSKPPTSKGLLTARRFNHDISLLPHELSTIVESESLVSAKLQRSRTPESLKSDKEVENEFCPAVVAFTPPTSQQEISRDFKKPTEIIEIRDNADLNLHTSSSDSLPDILTELVGNSTVQGRSKHKSDSSKQIVPSELVSDSSTSELENMESMLKSLGMGWAVATLRKTQEALALTSSSSSIDISLKQKEIKVTDSSSSTSEISIREVLGRQFLKKLSSGNGKSDEMEGSSSFIKELQDISGIEGSGGSHEKTTRRTSTPVQSGKIDDTLRNDSQPNIMVTGESELSSVRVHSDDNYNKDQFYSLNESSKSRNNSQGE